MCCSWPQAAITITSASTRGSRRAAGRSPTASPACTTSRSPTPRGAALADAAARLRDAGVPLRQQTDHGTHLAIYLSDPDGNDLELMWDRPFDAWPVDGDGRMGFVDESLDVDALIASEGLA